MVLTTLRRMLSSIPLILLIDFIMLLIDELDIFEALQIPEEWEDEKELDPYAEENAKILKEYGF